MDIAPHGIVDDRTGDGRTGTPPRDRHLVQFYEDETLLFDAVACWAARGLEEGEACVLLTTASHRDGIEERIRNRRVDLALAAADGRYIARDAEALLARCVVASSDGNGRTGGIDETRLRGEIAKLAAPLEERGLRIRVFGELTALLCADGETRDALRVERCWNRIAHEHSFSVLCGFPVEPFAGGENGELLDELFSDPERMILNEGRALLFRGDKRLRAIHDLRDRARGSCAELVGRRGSGAALSRGRLELGLDGPWDQEKGRNEFLASLAHELRNPLAPIRNALHLLRETGHDASVARYATDLMERQLGHMVRLIDDLIDVSRVTRNRLELRRTAVVLSSVIGDAVEAATPSIRAAGQELEVRMPEREVLLDADPVRLTQVFTNLLDNASKYTEHGGHIGLSVEPAADSVSVVVADDGIGIPREMLERIFDMFTQVDSSQHRLRSGLGIGLALAKRLVSLHGGTIEADSEGPGRGSRFTVRLPLLEARRSDPTAHDGPAARERSSARKVLVVDDSRDAADSLALLLERQGHEVRTAHDGHAALEIAEGFRPEVVLLDIGLPGLSGYDVARRIRAAPWSEGMALIALTGWGQESDRQRTREAGIGHHLVKPVDPVQLQKLILAS